MGSGHSLPSADSDDLHLSHPTPEECVTIWTRTSASWKDSLTTSAYVAESWILTTIPLAKDEGMTNWILVDKNLPPNKRQILCSCETLRKRTLVSDAAGNTKDVITHGIASVFCAPEYRRRGYAARHMRELAKVLRGWQSEHGDCVGTVLYSDIGKKFYSELGWIPNANNLHFELPAEEAEWPDDAHRVLEPDLEELCRRDEAMIRAALSTAEPAVEKRVSILPDLDHMLWHIAKEDFATKFIFGRIPQAKGAIAGTPGKQVWAIWTHRYYDHPHQVEDPGNVLYILRLVVEGDSTANRAYCSDEKEELTVDEETRGSLKAVLQAAQAEAAEWCLEHVSLWEPTPLVQSMIEADIKFVKVERDEESVASALWYDEGGIEGESPAWINNEHFAWC